MRLNIHKAADGVLILCALVVTGLTVGRWMSRGRQPVPIGAMHHINGWQAEFTFPRRIGDLHAPYQLVVWTDFQCPACRQFHQELLGAKKVLGDSLAVVVRYFPLAMHPLAFKAAIAAQCALAQGRFQQMESALFTADLEGTSLPLDSLSRQAGLPSSAALKRCMAEPAGSTAVRSDLARGNALGLRGTPTLQIGDQLGLGGMPTEDLIRLLRNAKHVN